MAKADDPYDIGPVQNAFAQLTADVLHRRDDGDKIMALLSSGARRLRLLIDYSAGSIVLGLVNPQEPKAKAEVIEIIALGPTMDIGLPATAVEKQFWGKPQ
jgi:hypothetical protein